jgi:hypothetical protein
MSTSRRQVGTRKGGMRVNMVDAFCIIYENRRMKSVEIVSKKEERGKGRTMEEVNPTKIYFKYICKYHNVSPCTTIIC